jgi:hypothetical protein
MSNEIGSRVRYGYLVRDGSPPVTANHPSDVPYPLPRRIRVGARVDYFPTRAAFPK